MNLFTPDLFRNFALGFVAGALLVGSSVWDQWTDVIEAPAHASAPVEMPSGDEAFAIVPLEES